jgi:hypothetical protein
MRDLGTSFMSGCERRVRVTILAKRRGLSNVVRCRAFRRIHGVSYKHTQLEKIRTLPSVHIGLRSTNGEASLLPMSRVRHRPGISAFRQYRRRAPRDSSAPSGCVIPA